LTAFCWNYEIMPWDQILGQENAIHLLRQAWLHGRLAHAYLFFGPEGVGKRLTLTTLVKAMNCQTPSTRGEACDHCPSCVKINSGNFADLMAIEPEGEGIKIEQIRALQKQLRFRPLEGGRRVCMIDPADKLNEAAAGALLKTLEEPPRDTHLFLITARPHQLLPTILSRCQWIKFRSLSHAQIVRILMTQHSMKQDPAHFLASLAGGSAGKALALSDRVDFQKRREWLRSFSRIADMGVEEILETCGKVAPGEEEVNELLELWKLWVRDLLVFKIEGAVREESLINRDLQEEIAKEAGKFSLAKLENIFDNIQDVQRAIAQKANRLLALETLMLKMKDPSGEVPLSP